MAPAPLPPGSNALTNQPVSCPLPAAQCLASYNWGGYAVNAPSGGVTQLSGRWTVPIIATAHGATCSDKENTWYDDSVWVGIDGLFTGTVEQTGTSSDCFYGQTAYYAWYEFYPAASVTIPITVNGGDTILALVTYSGGMFTTTIKDVNNGQSFTSPPTAVPGAARGSAEWIQESAYYNGFLALTPSSKVLFTSGVATINGVTQPIGDWGANLYFLAMVNYNFPFSPTYQYVKAVPGALSNGNTFADRWLSAGP